MAEYRIVGVNISGTPVQTTLVASNRFDIKKKASNLAHNKKFRITKIQKKVGYLYKVQKGNEKPVTGEQKAYSRDEVHNALTRMGYTVLRLERNLLDFKLPVPTKDIVILIRICADLLKEKFPFNEILQLIQHDIENKTLRQAIRDINQDLKSGKEGFEVFSKHEDVLGKFTTYMLSVASTSGSMHEIYESTAKFLERQEDFKKNIRSALLMPALSILACFGAIAFFLMYIFPKLTVMLTKYHIKVPPMTKATMAMSSFLQDHFLVLFLLIGLPIGGLIYYFTTPQGRYHFDRILISIPVIGTLMHKTSIEIFCRVFYSLYSGSGENINVIRIASEACRNTYMESKIKNIAIPMMLKEGLGFVESLERTGVFTQNALTRLRSGEESGTLRRTAMQIADYYEKDTTHKMGQMVDLINFSVSVIVMVMIIGLTLVSSELGFITPDSSSYFRR
ncbi:type II secretion system F family protein [candidate division KSB1 bacterium]|nr:type II secretion system F family protein [candidate division KSB1 bacterium]